MFDTSAQYTIQKKTPKIWTNIYIITDEETIDSKDSNIWRDEYESHGVIYRIIFMIPAADNIYRVVNQYGEILTLEASVDSMNYIQPSTLTYMADNFKMTVSKTYKPTHIRC